MTKDLMSYHKAKKYADRVVEILSPHCDKIKIAGSIRRECSFVKDVEVVCVPRLIESPSEDLFDKTPVMIPTAEFVRLVRDWERVKGDPLGRYTQRILPGGVVLDLFITNNADWGRQLAIRTGSAYFSTVKIASTWARKGWKGTHEGLRKKAQCHKTSSGWEVLPELRSIEGGIIMPPEFETERSFWDFLELEWIPPQDRSWKDPKNGKI